MSTEGYAHFLRSMGHQVRKSGQVYWFDAHPHIYMSFPFQQLVDQDAVDWKKVLQGDGWAARFPCQLNIGRASYRAVVDNPGYDLQSLASKARNQTRRGLESCEVRPLDFQELLADGITLNRETLERQGRKATDDFDLYWKRYYAEAAKAEGGHAWGSFVDGMLASYLIAFVMEDVSHVLIVRSSQAYLKRYPNNALIYEYLRYMLHGGLVREVSIGLESIQEGMDSLDHFKLGMGFRKEPVGQRIVLKPWLSRLIRPPLLGIGQSVLRHMPNNETITKIAGLLRWYNEQPKSSGNI